MFLDIDVRDVLPAIHVPTLVLHRRQRPRRATSGRALARRADPRQPLRRARGRRPCPLGRRRRRGARRDRGVPDRRAPRARARPRAGDGAVHRHRRLDPARGRARRPPLARAARAPPRRSCATSSSGSAGREVKTTGRRVPRDLRRPGPRGRCARAIAARRPRSGSRSGPGCTPARSS